VAALQPRRKTAISSGLKNQDVTIAADKEDDILKKKPLALAEVAMEPPPASNAESTPLDEMIMGTIAKQKDSVEMPLTVAVTKKATSQTLVSKAEGVQIIKDKRTDNAYELSKLNLPPNFLTGTVINNQATPMPGATIKVEGKPLILANMMPMAD
jgi:hypothetical protein